MTLSALSAAMVVLALDLGAGPCSALPYQRYPVARVEDDWAWADDAGKTQETPLVTAAVARTGTEAEQPAAPRARRPDQAAAKAEHERTAASQAIELDQAVAAADAVLGRAPAPSAMGSLLVAQARTSASQGAGAERGWASPPALPVAPRVPSVEEILTMNTRMGCITIESPLAKSNMVKKVAKIGTPCLFRADEFDEASHCMNSEGGEYGQYGWCWTKLDRSEWGSCSKACPLAGGSAQLGDKLKKLEALVDQLTQAVGV
eukprot:CAMPEP_0204601822 /NCGR_PEP_ID=MMETSP0661-20131031/56280_1 /ASSEMBLY_ACC=CAM_ASM_000606 /TAXON_ID=109239 /ORGANISM="Alexandrium margalefi, Strain AMGDE01CS-322" /LENGTH=260 /DNA_ID=CAMNT_0051612741 /DNA_START=57 /DNA_END=839 /DNA_ORIENTATION=-